MKKIAFALISLLCIFHITTYAAENGFVVVIDAGHGGKDGGAMRGNYKEKEINLKVALALGRLIEANMSDVKVVYTRKNDVFVDLYKRANIANKAKANLFISIHTNSTASKETKVSGADTYILGLAKSEENLAVAKRENSVILLEDNYNSRYEGFDPNSPESYIMFEFMTNKYMEQSLQFASHVQSGFSQVARRVDRGVLQAGFLVLRESGTPSVLIELGFINNPTEAKYLASSAGQQKMAHAIYTGFDKYKKEFDKKQGKSYARTAAANQKDTVRAKDTESDKNQNEPTGNTALVDSNKIKSSRLQSKSNQYPTQAIENGSPNRSGNKQAGKSTTGISNKDNLPKIPKTSQEVNNKSNPVVSQGVIEYRVQFLTAGSKLPSNSPNFKGLSPVGYYVEGSTYKYTYGSATSESEVLKIQRQVRTKFKDAFVVRFKNNVRIK